MGSYLDRPVLVSFIYLFNFFRTVSDPGEVLVHFRMQF